MKKIILSLAAVVLTVSVFAQKTVADVAKIASEIIDLGKVKQGVPVTATFVVTNVSKDPLIIEQANPTCGCTIGDYTKSPIAPGKTGTITATYNAAAVNPFTKTLTVKFAGVDDYAKWQSENPSSVVKSEIVVPTVVKPTSAAVVPVKAKTVKVAKPKKAVTVKS
jgi:hypothetical protein